jgi:hypothetical protein
VPRGRPGAAGPGPYGALGVLDRVVVITNPCSRACRTTSTRSRSRSSAATCGVEADLPAHREVIAFHRAVDRSAASSQLRWSFSRTTTTPTWSCAGGCDVEDHATRVLERVENFRALLTNLVNVEPPSRSGRTTRWRGSPRRVSGRRAGQADIVLGGDRLRADARGEDLRNELDPPITGCWAAFRFEVATASLLWPVRDNDWPGSAAGAGSAGRSTSCGSRAARDGWRATVGTGGPRARPATGRSSPMPRSR